jgi:hypothetical protein
MQRIGGYIGLIELSSAHLRRASLEAEQAGTKKNGSDVLKQLCKMSRMHAILCIRFEPARMRCSDGQEVA